MDLTILCVCLVYSEIMFYPRMLMLICTLSASAFLLPKSSAGANVLCYGNQHKIKTLILFLILCRALLKILSSGYFTV